MVYTCPPEGQPGYELGDTIVDMDFSTCDGIAPTSSFHEECGAPTLIINVYGWCAPCIEHISDSGDLMAQFPELQVVVVVTENPLSEPADTEYCTQLRDFSDIGGTWLIDPERQFEAYGGPGLAVVLTGQGEIVFARDDATADAIREAVEEVVGD